MEIIARALLTIGLMIGMIWSANLAVGFMLMPSFGTPAGLLGILIFALLAIWLASQFRRALRSALNDQPSPDRGSR